MGRHVGRHGRGHTVEVLAGLLQAHVGLQAPHHLQEVAPPVLHRRIPGQGPPDLHPWDHGLEGGG
ncbi:MAG: hypothetical protein MI919_38320 [Holophagales bacterium]|nr:hypothetical protein [Holophagales bacterium]